MNTTENNKLLAEFLGWKIGHPEILELRWSNEWFEGMDKKTTKGYLYFNSDWNWLMQVVEKIENTSYKEDSFFNVHIGSLADCTIQNAKYEQIINKISTTKIEAVYDACVEFVKWYNKNCTK